MTVSTDGYVLGVDLGTSNTVAMLRRPDGRTRPLLFDGRPLLPSAVYLDTSGTLHVGRDAVRLGDTDPGRLEPHPKRHVDAATLLLGDDEVPVVDALAALLGEVAREAVAVAGLLPPAVLTCPASWGGPRRAVLAAAAVQAGWPEDTPMLPEPVAAARYFAEVLHRPVPVGGALAVFDFGGGTLDVAVVRNEGLTADGRPRFTVAACGGVADLGGLDLDAALVDHLGEGLAAGERTAWTALADPSSLGQWRDRRRFWNDVRGAKEMLSRASAAPVAVPGVEQAVSLTRDELETLVTPLVRRGVDEAAEVVAAAGFAPGDLAGLFLVGGSSRVPLVARLLHERLGVAPTVLDQPELPVAEGATVGTGGAAPAGTAAPEAPAVTADAAPATTPARAPAAAGGPAPAPAAAPPVPAPLPPPVTPPAATPVPAAAGPPARAGYPPGMPTADPRYAEPVDPWATGEVRAFGDGPYPYSPVWPLSPAAGDGFAPPAPPRRRWLTWLVAAVAAVAVGAGVSLAVLLWPREDAVRFTALTPVQRITAQVPVSYQYSDAAVRDGRAYFASAPDKRPLEVVAVRTETGAAIWRSTEAGTAATWLWSGPAPGGYFLALTGTDLSSDRRRLVVLGDDGRRRWERSLGSRDTALVVGETLVLVDRAAGAVIGLPLGGGGAEAWRLTNPQDDEDAAPGESPAAPTVRAVSTPGDLAAPADPGDVPVPVYSGADRRIVRIAPDRSAAVIDTTTGAVLAERPNVGDPGAEMIAHAGRLVYASGDNGYTLVAYDLARMGEPEVLLTAPASEGHRLTGLTACGADRVCFLDETDTAEQPVADVVAVDAADGGQLWRRRVPRVETLLPVGDAVLAAEDAYPPKVSLLAPDGSVAWQGDGEAGRVDAASVLLFSKQRTVSPDDPALVGLRIGDDPVQLGPLADLRSATCAWDTTTLACVGERDFALLRYAE